MSGVRFNRGTSEIRGNCGGEGEAEVGAITVTLSPGGSRPGHEWFPKITDLVYKLLVA
jgi:hypothetical protein